jgi:Imidazoleglycerol-phosphate synthase
VGGIRSINNIQNLLKAGADKVSINSAALKDPNVIKIASQYFGSQCIVVAVDVKKNNNHWTVYSHGGTKNTGIEAIQWLRKVEELGAGEILLTSMDKDGTKSGFDLEVLSLASETLSIPVIASGGVGKIEHFYEGVIKGQANALLAASVFHFNEFSIMDVKNYLKQKNIEVRI